MIRRTLNALGSSFRLRSLADELKIERLTAERDGWEAKFKTAITDLEKQAGEMAELGRDRDEWKASALGYADSVTALNIEIDKLTPDALAMRRKRQMDRDRRKGRG